MATDIEQGQTFAVNVKERTFSVGKRYQYHGKRVLCLSAENGVATFYVFRVYGQWAGNPAGHIENREHCVAKVWPNDRGAISRQCTRARGHGPAGLYCKQHAAKL